MIQETNKHQPVMLAETLEYLNLQPSGYYIDCTFGRGGHSRGILANLGLSGHLLALDRDPAAISAGFELATNDPRLELVHTEFSNLEQLAVQRGLIGKVNGVILDLGVSSPQLETPERGFSFLHDGPLDMRMNTQHQGPNAAQWLSQASASDIAQVLHDLGEERHARRIAKAIVSARLQSPINNTRQLADIVAAANPAWEINKHPATRSFQAIRIFINNELDELATALKSALNILIVGGRLLVVSFHSLEDRIVKRMFKQGARGDNLPRRIPVTADAMHPTLHLITGAIRPKPEEVNSNPRARSAVLRVAEKIG